jgi:hypothetical protein
VRILKNVVYTERETHTHAFFKISRC